MSRWSLLKRETVAVVRLATPVALVQIGMMLMGTVDAMMLGRYSEQALAAGALGNSVSFGLITFPMGILMALDPLVAQAFGAQSHELIRRHFKQGLLLAAALSVPLSAVMWQTEGVLLLTGQRPEIAADGAAYIRVIAAGNLPFLLFVAIRQTLQAMSKIRPAAIAIVIANGINVVANYALIFGNFGCPELGVVGSAWATSISRWVMFLGLAGAAWPVVRRYLAGSWRELMRLSAFIQPLRLGVPIGVHVSLEMWLFTAVALMMGNLGARELAAHQIALTLSALSYMVPLGISGAAATRVGNAIGRGDAGGARRSAVACLALGAGVMSLAALAFVLAPHPLSRLFTAEAGVIAVAVTLLPVAAAFQVFDGLQVVAIGALRGTADTRIPAVIALVGYWGLGLPLGALLGFRAGMGPQGLWWGLTIGLGSVAILVVARLWVRLSSQIAAVD